MQTEVPTLPVVHSNTSKSLPRKQSDDTRNLSSENKNSLPCNSTAQISSNKKYLQSSLGGPYKSSTKLHSLPNKKKADSTSSIGQRVTSAKMLRIKQLQNQLADAHYHLNELSNENRLLKALQKRQDSALRRYEGANAELPKIISSHHEELRVLQTKYKKLKNLHKETSELLKEKENELYSLQSQNKHLLQLSKDRNLGEREKLQIQVSDLNHRIHQQQDTIQSLQKKLALESKSLKQQLHLEVTKHRETQKHLQEVMKKMKTLEKLLDSREKRIYYNDQLHIFNTGKNVGRQPLTNVRRVSTSLRHDKIQGAVDKAENDGQRDSLPMLHSLNLNDGDTRRDINSVTDANETPDLKTETMASLQQVRKFRLQRPVNSRSNSAFDEWRQKNLDEIEMRTILSKDGKTVSPAGKSDNSEDVEDYQIRLHQYDEDIGKFEQNIDSKQSRSMYKLPKEIKEQYGYISSDAESEDGESLKEKYDVGSHTQKSQELHARLINNAEDALQSKEESTKLDKSQLQGKVAEIENLVAQEIERKIYEHKSDLQALKFHKIEYQNDVELPSEMKEEPENLKFRTNHKGLSMVSSSSVRDHPEPSSNSTSGKEFIKFLNDINTKFEEEKSLERNTNLNVKSTIIGNDEKILQNLSLEAQQIEVENKEDETKAQNADSKIKETFVDEIHTYPVNKLTSQKINQPQNALMVPKSVSNEYNEQSDYIGDNSQEESSVNVQSYSEESTQDSFEALEKSIMNNPDKVQSKDFLSNNVQSIPSKSDLNHTGDGVTEQIPDSYKQTVQHKHNTKVPYNKEKLLATMKAIDDNENIEFLEVQGHQKQNIISRTQITENLFRGLPAHNQRKRDVIRDIFTDDNIENKPRNTCSKIH